MTDLLAHLHPPFDGEYLMRSHKRLLRALSDQIHPTIEKRIAVIGGCTTTGVVDMLRTFLLASGIRATFYESDYNRYYEDGVYGNAELDAFHPEIVIVYTHEGNIIYRSTVGDSDEIRRERLADEFARWKKLWECIQERYGAILIQNNFDFPPTMSLGSLDAVCGRTDMVLSINAAFAEYARSHAGFYLHDMCSLCARLGRDRWHDRRQFHAYKLVPAYDCIPETAWSLAALLRAILGQGKKCLVLDLDDTLWGGVIGDDGVDGIVLGRETARGEAYVEVQSYLCALQRSGIILAVCSKNDDAVARSGFSHPDSVLHVEDFASFHANWRSKAENIHMIADEIGIGLDSMVFLDDNPVERELVRQQLPMVAVPEISSADVFGYIRALEAGRYFESAGISSDDLNRSTAYTANMKRNALAENTATYDEFLKSLDMSAEIAPFRPVYYDRIAQLTNKSNQFNLTTRRYTRADIAQMAETERFVTLYGRLTDKLGDNGLISVVIGEKREKALHILLWLMSCRVLKRGMEQMMLDVLVEAAAGEGLEKLIGYYIPTPKNSMVRDLYATFGFHKIQEDGAGSIWEIALNGYRPQGRFIKRIRT